MAKLSKEWEIVEEGDYRKEDIGYPKILLMHLERISRVSSMLYGPNEIRMFSEMLDTLETYLSPYFNQDYRNAIKKLDKMHPKTLNQLVPNPDRRYRMTTIEKNRMISNEYYKVLREKERLRFAALVKLMDTRNLLLQEEGEMVFDAEEQEKIDKERKNDNRKRRQSRKDDKEPVVEEES